jgi:FMN phosphatase YigB (HAD superfamily)
MGAIKNIIFDLGGVLLNIDYYKVVTGFEALGIPDFESWYSQKNQIALFDKLETGHISPEDFRHEMRNHIPGLVADAEIDAAWNAILLDFPAERMHMLEHLKTKYRCFLLSNTNEIHIKDFSSSLANKFGAGTFESMFEKVYYSSRMGLRKPIVQIYQYVLDEQGLDPKETLFIDDSLQNIEGAQKAGLQTVFLQKGMSVLDLFDKNYDLIS